MPLKTRQLLAITICGVLILQMAAAASPSAGIPEEVRLTTADSSLSVTIGLDEGCRIEKMEIQGIGNILSQEGTYTGAVVSDGRLSSCDARNVRVAHKGNSLTVKDIKYGNGIYEMMNNGTGDRTCSDWLDIVWASFENAFVNEQFYEALTHWSRCERILGDTAKADRYEDKALRLKEAFNNRRY